MKTVDHGNRLRHAIPFDDDVPRGLASGVRRNALRLLRPTLDALRWLRILMCVTGTGHTADEFAGLLRSGLARLNDARNSTLALESRFDLAYNAAHALCPAALRWQGYRPEALTDVDADRMLDHAEVEAWAAQPCLNPVEAP